MLWLIWQYDVDSDGKAVSTGISYSNLQSTCFFLYCIFTQIWAIYYKSLTWFTVIFGGIPLLFTTIWGDYSAGKVVINCPDKCSKHPLSSQAPNLRRATVLPTCRRAMLCSSLSFVPAPIPILHPGGRCTYESINEWINELMSERCFFEVWHHVRISEYIAI